MTAPAGPQRMRCDSVEETAALAERLAALAGPGHLVVLVGPLGAGKTTFAKAYARALGVVAPVTSPTFTLVHQYRCDPAAAVGLLLHVDLWRLEHAGELDDLALDELLDEGAAAIVEWGDRFDVAPGRPRVEVTFHVLSETARELEVVVTDASDVGGPDASTRADDEDTAT